MIYEVLKASGVPGESRATFLGRQRRFRRSLDGKILVIKYPRHRPSKYRGHKSLVKGDAQKVIRWLEARNKAFGISTDKKRNRFAWAWWAAAAASAAGGALYYVLG